MMDNIKLTLPARKEYIVTARLTAGSVAGRAGFDIDEIDDVKTACSEACLLLLLYSKPGDELELIFSIGEQGGIGILAKAPHFGTQTMNTLESDFSVFMLEALMDEVDFYTEDGIGVYKLYKAPHV